MDDFLNNFRNAVADNVKSKEQAQRRSAEEKKALEEKANKEKAVKKERAVRASRASEEKLAELGAEGDKLRSEVKDMTKDFLANFRDMMRPDNLSRIVSGQPYIPKDKRIEIENQVRGRIKEAGSALNEALPKIASSIASAVTGQPTQGEVQVEQSGAATAPATTTAQPETETEQETVEYTYTPGDTFGRVLMKMGLSDGRNLWGPDGDVAYYTKQLNDQGIYGNIPIGKTIRLRRRPRV